MTFSRPNLFYCIFTKYLYTFYESECLYWYKVQYQVPVDLNLWDGGRRIEQRTKRHFYLNVETRTGITKQNDDGQSLFNLEQG